MARKQRTNSDVAKYVRENRTSYGFGRSCVPGTFTVEITVDFMPTPIGVVWFRFIGRKTIDVLHSFVHANSRRLGVRALINAKLFEAYPGVEVIRTDGGTAEGKAFMRAAGYVRHADRWELKRKRKR